MGTCPACGGPTVPWRSVTSSEPSLRQQRFDLSRCTACGSAGSAGEAPAGLHELGAYRDGRPALYGLARPALDAFDRRRLALLRPLLAPPARLLDVGAGRGRFVAAARAAGYDASGIEPSRRGVRAAEMIGVRLSAVAIEQAEFPDRTLDGVSLWHVLEHLDEPGAALSRIATWLRPDGVLLVGVPNLASLQARIGSDRWYHLDVPRHRSHFTAAGLRALLWSHGFTVVRIHHVLFEHNPYGMWQSCVNRLTTNRSYLYNLLKRNAPMRSADLAITALVLPLAPLAAVAELIAGVIGHGGTIAVLARRTANPSGGVG